MLTIKLAWRNLVGAGLRTWLNAFVLSFSFVAIIWHRGFLDGWQEEARIDTIDWQIGGGQIWHEKYDAYDPFTLEDSHSRLPDAFSELVKNDKLAPVLIGQATIYPQGRMQSVLIKGISPQQQIVKLPTEKLAAADGQIPVIIGKRTANSAKLKPGDVFPIRWRDANGTFDAAEAVVAAIFKTNVAAVDMGQLWLPLAEMQKMMQLPGEATLLIAAKNIDEIPAAEKWRIKSVSSLLEEIDTIIRQKKVGGSILYIILLAMAMLAIFDTQVLSIFRRQKEIGTHIALGMTRAQVVWLFTAEGAMHGIFAAILAVLYGFPLLAYNAKVGFSLPAGTDDYGITIAEKIFPSYTIGLVFWTTVIVLLTATFVSFLPTRKITKLQPTEALRGKIQ